MKRAQQISSPALTGEGPQQQRADRSAGGGRPPPLAGARPSPVRTGEDLLPTRFADWFASRGWSARPHQPALIERAAQGKSVLLVAPNGGGQTLAGFLPSLIELAALPARRQRELHTIYISPLKALAVDV